MKKSIWMAGLGLALTLSLAGTASAGTPGFNQRQQNQHHRIREGVKSGELTRPEARRLRVGQAHLQMAEARAKRDGEVTARERAHLQHEANQQSRRIHRQKHDRQDRN